MFTTKEDFKSAFSQRLESKFGRTIEDSHVTERYEILGHMIRDYAGQHLKRLRKMDNDNQPRQLIYFSMEFLMGRLMKSNLHNLGILETVKAGLEDMGVSLDELMDLESDAGLGNGGLGRLAACFLDDASYVST